MFYVRQHNPKDLNPKEVQIVIPEPLNSYMAKRDFIDMIKLRIFR